LQNNIIKAEKRSSKKHTAIAHVINNNMQKRLLVIDDDKDLLEMIRIYFEMEGYSIFTLTQVDNIFKAYSQYNPDVILLDYKLQEENGDKLCQQLKSNPATFDIPIIMISGYSKAELERDYHGWDAVVSKPFDLTVLQKTVEKFMKKPVNEGE
jgi:CheY-like chemotaxis protein